MATLFTVMLAVFVADVAAAILMFQIGGGHGRWRLRRDIDCAGYGCAYTFGMRPALSSNARWNEFPRTLEP